MACRLLRADCSLTSTGIIPINDLGLGSYQGFTAGLYPAGSNPPPAAHAAAALAIATDQIKPLNASGNLDLVNGRIVMISIGMSNTTQEFATKGTQPFKLRADADPAKNPQLVIVDGAQGGQDAPAWVNPTAATWSTVNQRLTAAGVTAQQVQVAWLKQALAGPNNYGAFPAHAQTLQSDLEIIARNLKTNFPNIKITYLSTRTRAYTNTPTALNPEPFAYETGFAVKWAIGDQINGAGNLNFDPANGAVVAPLLLWGPYTWADGLTPRSDGFTWLCSDLEADFTHPTASGGVPKVATHLLAFFKTDPTAVPWFLKGSVTGQPPQVTAGASVSSGPAPLSVNFTASAIDPDGTIIAYQWTFDDGTFSVAQNPAKTFPAPGNYSVHLTVTDNSGNTTLRTLPISVAPAGSSPTPTSTPTPPPPTPTATATATATSSPTPTPPTTPTPASCAIISLNENFDAATAPALPAGWVSSFIPGPASCSPGGTCALGTNWTTSTTNPSSPPNSVFHDAPGCVTDSTLDTPSFLNVSGSILDFVHQYDLASGFDGAVLEISINGGPFTDFVAAGGGFVPGGGYNGTIAVGTQSPIAGRAAWTGNSGGYFTSFATMPPAASSQPVRLRFRVATDCSGSGTGWRLDNIRVLFSIPCNSPTPTPSFPPPTPTPATPSPTPTATATVPTSTPTPTPFFFPVYWEGFDAVTAPALPAGWGTSFTPGPANCTPTGTCALGTNWVTSTASSQTAPNAAFHDAPSCVTDSSLDTPSIFIPTSPFPSVLYFYQHYDLEAGHDGGVLEISIEGGPFTDIVAAGGSADYNGTISTGFFSPIAGRQAWTGNSGSYFRTSAVLPSATMGHNVVLRFRLATDCAVAGTGWYVDSLYIAYFNDFHPTPTPPPLSPTPTAPPTATPIPTPCGVTFSENFDGVTAPALPSGWTTTITGSGDPWETSTIAPFSAPNDAVGPAAFNIGNAYLFSPAMAGPAAGGILSFQNLYNLQSGGPPFTTGYDGMVLEISVNGAAYVDVITAGGSFVAGGYTGTISTGNGSPISGRMAWTGISAGSMETPAYITSTVNLPATANGQSIQLRWRIATDSIPNFGMGAPGARIDGIVLTPATCATPTPTPSPTPAAQALQLSTRMLVQTGDNVGIGGFIITGSVPKRVLLRAVGPSLTGFGVPDALADPVLELHGPPGFVTIINDNCGDFVPPISPPFCTPGSLEAAIGATLEPGAYTAIVRGKNNTSGVALVEVYDLNQSVDSKLANISTRAFVSTGDNIVIAGFILGGNNGSDRIIVRGLGPSLTGFGVPNALANPTLELRDENGALLVANNNWQDNPAQAAELTAAGLAPTNPLESGIAATLLPGLYTALLAGQDNGIGVGVVEVYDRGAAP